MTTMILVLLLALFCLVLGAVAGWTAHTYADRLIRRAARPFFSFRRRPRSTP